ncbi:non-ribosomal peptide synthetase [Thalassomonas sp. RHCl1]|uniref:non-ribosomal peptide synthetase n=1 Tax=Thalassomonas sp. RHCl1 TaxID=2995320 RepID=UPI00248B6884|nr:non-ribosomal peptide synthetase [Thalassomonas sp. RHCl1]
MAIKAESIIEKALDEGIHLFLEDGKLGFKQKKGSVFSPALKQEIVANKAEIIDFLGQYSSQDKVARTKVTRFERSGAPVSLSFSQQRLWFMDKLNGGSAEYNMPAAFEVVGDFDLATAEQALERIIKRHEILRTVYIENQDETLQHIREDVNFQFARHDLSSLNEQEQAEQLSALIARDLHQSFDLTKDLMVRAGFVTLSEGSGDQAKGVLLFNMHHIASDGWSMDVLIREFVSQYQVISLGQADPFPPLEIQYSDYAQWQRQWLQGEVLDKQLAYWDKQLADAPQVHNLVLDKPRPEVQQHMGACVSGQLPKSVAQSLQSLARQFNLTPFMLLHSALALVYSRHSNSHDIVIGTSVANRMQSELEPLIGFFVNTLVLRLDTSYQRLDQYLQHVRQVHLDAQNNQDVPLEQLVERLNVTRDTSYTPLFQLMMASNSDYALGDKPADNKLELAGITLSPLAGQEITSKFDIDVDLCMNDDGVALTWTYDTSIFSHEHISEFNEHMLNLLTAYAKVAAELGRGEEVNTADLSMLSTAQEQYLLETLNDNALEYAKDKLVHELFEQCAAARPDDTAVVFGDSKLSYGQLNEQANRLAHYLHGQGVKPDSLVGICLDRSLEMTVAILAILKAGGAYVPLDPAYPQERLSHMLDDADLKLVITKSSLGAALDLTGRIGFCLDREDLAQYPAENLSSSVTGVTPGNLAYVIYTSGSTGRPKGVMVEHRQLNCFLSNVRDRYQIRAEDNVLQFSTINFDIFVEEYFGALCHGATLVLRDEDCMGDLVAFYQFCRLYQVSIVSLPTSFWHQLMLNARVSPPEALRLVIVGGEALQLPLVKAWLSEPDAPELINTYGPTEATVTACGYHIKAGEISYNTPPIGKANKNVALYVLNEFKQVTPFGSVGELYIGGEGVARGYLNQAQLTQESFIASPFSENGDERLYKSGDLVRYLPDGNLEFIGRADDQVKIRGFRIELGEIENQLSRCDNVASTLVLALEDETGQKQLAAYVNPQTFEASASGQAAFIESLKDTLQQTLPEYMVPAAFVVMEQWPLTANGKIDKKALPSPDSNGAQGNYLAPQTPVEQTLSEIWGRLLKMDAGQISTDANFFALGGHSLLTVRLVAEIRKQLKVEVSVKAVFDAGTILELAQVIAEKTSASLIPQVKPVARNNDTMALSFAQQRLWFIDQLQGGSAEYNMPVAFEVSGAFDADIAEQALGRIIDRHEILRTRYLEKSPEKSPEKKVEDKATDSFESKFEQHFEDKFENKLAKTLESKFDSNEHNSPAQQLVQGGEALQQIMPEADFKLTRHDLSGLDAGLRQYQLSALIDADMRQSFDLTKDLMVRASYVALDKESGTGALLFNMHHIASDGWSMEVLVREFVSQYKAIASGQANPLPPLEIQYADYAHWQRQWLQGEVLEKQLSYWDKQLSDVPAVHSLVLDKARPEEKQHVGDIVSGKLSSRVAQQLQALAKHYQLTPFMLLHSALALVLSRHSNSSDIVIGSPIANRMQAELEPLIGFFVNTLVLRLDTAHDQLEDYFRHVRQVHLDAQNNQDVPFEQLVERLNIPRSTAHTPLFQIMLSTDSDYGMDGDNSLELDGVTLSPLESDCITAKFDLDIGISMNADGVDLQWTFDTSIFTREHVGQFNAHLETLLTAMAELSSADKPAADTKVNALAMLTAQESDYLIHGLNNSAVDYPQDKGIHELFAAQALQTPDNIALVCEDHQLSYRELNENANRLARYLSAQGVEKETFVGVCLNRSAEMVVAVLAILKAGGAYVPLDPGYPQARLQHILTDTGVRHVLTATHLAAALNVEQDGDISAAGLELLCLDDAELQAKVLTYPCTEVESSEGAGQAGADLAYVIYTSGSTGLPKGVMVEHHSVTRLVHSSNYVPLDENTRFLQSAPIAFDAATLELWGPLLNGGQCIIYGEQQIDLQQLTDFVVRHEVNTLWLTSGLFEQWSEMPIPPSAIKYLLAGGDVLNVDAVNRVREKIPGICVINGYGPTENTTFTTCYSVNNDVTLNSNIPIGKAIQNTSTYVLTDSLTLTPLGAVGELYTGGAGVARGYLNQEQATQASFIANPFSDNEDDRLYKTGDLVRYLSDGNLEFIGRADNQVKVRGFRIELAEIEHQLNLCQTVHSAVVLAKGEGSGDKQLVAYVKGDLTHESEEEKTAFVTQLKVSLARALPDYMVPDVFVVVDEWSLTANGKIDKKALLGLEGVVLQTEYVAPQTDIEKSLVQIWSSLLKLDADKISITANFFELGGHSLLVTRLKALIESEFGMEFNVKDLFELSDITSVAQVISKNLLKRDLDSVESELLDEVEF